MVVRAEDLSSTPDFKQGPRFGREQTTFNK